MAPLMHVIIRKLVVPTWPQTDSDTSSNVYLHNYTTVGSGTSEGLPSGGESLVHVHSLVLLVSCSTEHCAPDLHAKQAKVTVANS